ncbi:MAG: ABC transporter substrate-binding protein [Cellulomonadaceae bacterium]
MATTTLRIRSRARALVALTAVAALTTLTACSSDTDAASPSADGTPSGTLEILVSSADASDAAFRAINEAFMTKYPDVEVTFASVPNDNYPASKSSRLTANNVDIVVVKNFVEVPAYAEGAESDDARLALAGAYLDLTDQDFMTHYNPTVLEAQAFAGKQLSVPTGLSYSTGMYYNKEIFADHGIEVPTTWAELTAAIETLDAAGVTPFGIGGQDSWPAGLPMLAAVQGQYPDQEAKQELAKDLWEGAVSLTDEGPQAVLDRTAMILKHTQNGMAGISYDATPAGFAAGDYAMLPDGTWNQPTIDAAVDGAFEYGYMPIPTSDDAEANSSLNGKVELQLAVPAGAKNQANALAWLEFFSDPVNYATFVELSGFSPAQTDIEQSAFLEGISDYTKDFGLAWEQVWTGNPKAGQAALFPFNYPALTPLGTMDARQAAEAAQKDWAAGL